MAATPPRPPTPPAPRTPLQGLVTTLWRQALFAIPMAIFFGTLYAGAPGGFVRALKMSLVFSYVIGLTLWALEFFVIPRLPARRGESHTAGILRISFIYTGTSFLGAALAAWLLHVTIIPGFLGSGRSVAIIGMYTVLFAVLTTGIVLAVIFYRDALQRVRAEQELDLARRIQRAFLISQFPAMPRIEVHAVNVSSRQMSGDFYDEAGDDMTLVVLRVHPEGAGATANA